VTDSAGAFTITDVAPGTTLIIKETRAKAGYILDDTPQTVKVKSNEVVTVEFRNERRTRCNIRNRERTCTVRHELAIGVADEIAVGIPRRASRSSAIP